MNDFSRRLFLTGTPGLSAVALSKPVRALEDPVLALPSHEVDLCTEWRFQTDPERVGEKNNWQSGNVKGEEWLAVAVPHTWQIHAPSVEYRGEAWYIKSFSAPRQWERRAVRIEFEAVYSGPRNSDQAIS